MLKSSGTPAIRLRGVRHNNLKNFDLDLPLNKLIVITGLSGSGKSSLAFDTLFAEGQRRYIETFSPYARQFLDRMDKPRVDSISGIPPAIAIEQRNSVKTTRSTVGTMTEICDFMKLLWPHVARLHCRSCGRPVGKETPSGIWRQLSETHGTLDALITFSVPLSDKLSLDESLALVAKQGYQRLVANGRILRIAGPDNPAGAGIRNELVVVQDRIRIIPSNRARFTEACEQAYHFGKGKLSIYPLRDGNPDSSPPLRFSNRLHCAPCDLDYREPSPALFNFNHPVGACPACKGFGRIISIDYSLAVPDRSRTLRQGVVKPWMTGQGAECQTDLLRMCRQLEIPVDVPFEKLSKEHQDLVIEGEPDYGKDEEHEWPRAWYGVKGYFRWLESRAYKMHVRVLLSRYRSYASCPACGGSRFQPEAMLYRLSAPEGCFDSPRQLTLSDFYQLPIRDSFRLVRELGRNRKARAQSHDPLSLILPEVFSRLGFLNQVGLGYLTLDRPTRSLSGGETERVNLTSCLGTRLVNTLFVLDEPSVGLHPRDTERLVRILQQLRDAGNTVVVVEHEAGVMRAADQIVDLGPGHGSTGGEVVFQGTYREILKSRQSLTGRCLLAEEQRRSQYPSRSEEPAALRELHAAAFDPKTAVAPEASAHGIGARTLLSARDPRSTPIGATLRLRNATCHNLRDFGVDIPLGKLVCVTGLSGSGKTTLVREVLLPCLQQRLRSQDTTSAGASERMDEEKSGSGPDSEPEDVRVSGAILEGWKTLGGVALVDQSILGKTPRSNPAVYIGAFDHIRDFFAASEPARRRGLNSSAFSFNSAQGQCERCRGAGFEKIEMQFLSDVFIKCPDCNGRRYREHILQIKVQGRLDGKAVGWSIFDLLDATVEEAVGFLSGFAESRPAGKAVQSLQWLGEVGLGYLKLGQPINTLSGGESQRLKLVRHLAGLSLQSQVSSLHSATRALKSRISNAKSANDARPTLFLFDEPTTGLHFEDVRVLLRVLRRLVGLGHSVVVIEHNLDVVRSSDWVIDLGPGAGDEGGRLVAEGNPEDIARVEASETGKALR